MEISPGFLVGNKKSESLIIKALELKALGLFSTRGELDRREQI